MCRVFKLNTLIDNNVINGMKFTTRDRENDPWSNCDCAADKWAAGGWWYKYCSTMLLNYQYTRFTSIASGIIYQFVEMKIRLTSCSVHDLMVVNV